VIFTAFGVFTLLYVNFPDDVVSPYGVHRHAVSFFLLIWSYPLFSVPPSVFRIAAVLTILILWAGYLSALGSVLRLRQNEDHSHLVAPILGFALAFNLLLVAFFPPILSGDVFHYAIQGRLYAVHGLNPYVAPASQVVDDPFWSLTIWKEGTTQYGPVWIQLAALCSWIGGGSILLTVFCFKLLAALSNFFGGLIVLTLARRFTGGDGVAPLLFYAWNPILLLESAGTAHNDAVMMTLALLGVYLVVRGNLHVGVAALLASAMIKYVTLLLLVLVVFHAIARQPEQRGGTALRLGVFGLVIVVLFYAPFLSGVADPLQLLTGVSPSLNPMQNEAGMAVRRMVGSLLQSTGIDGQQYASLALNAAFGVFVLLLLPGLASPKATWADVLGRFGMATLIYTLLIYGGSFPWYLVCPLSVLALAPPTRTTLYTRLITVGLGVGLMLFYVPWLMMPVAK
jgi:hypothetical protein